MTNTVIGTFRVGEDIAIALDAVSGDPATVATVTARLRSARVLSDGIIHFSDRASAIDMVVASRAAEDDFPAGWNIALSASATAALDPGLYGIDAKLIGPSGVVDITDTTALINLTQAAIE